MNKTRESTGEKIRRLRSSLGLTQGQVAESAEIPFRTYQDIEYGKSIPRTVNLGAIARALNVPLESLLAEPIIADQAMLPPPTKSDLIAAIVVLLPTLNELELRAVLSQAEESPSLLQKRNARAIE